MLTLDARIEEIRQDGADHHLVLALPRAMRPAAGQYFAANGTSQPEYRVYLFYPVQVTGQHLTISGMIPDHWSPGEVLRLRGPLGRGFGLPHLARRVGLVSLMGGLTHLQLLIRPALEQEAAVAACSAILSAGLPEEVEYVPADSLAELVAWADYLAVEVGAQALPGLNQRLGINPANPPAAKIEVFVRVDLPCAGMGECGICAVTTRKGWKLACKAGPVFDYRDLEI